MQYLKDEIKKRIISSALQEFYDKGFAYASMRQIAGDAGIALGNVYRYFKNKEDLFAEIIDPVYKSLFSLLENYESIIKPSSTFFEDVVDILMPIIYEHKTQLLLLVDKSKGTKYEDVKEKLILVTQKVINDALTPMLEQRGVSIRDPFIFSVIAATFFEGIFIIIRKYDDEQEIRYLAYQLLSISFNDIEKRFV